MHRSAVIWWVHIALTLPRLEVQFPLDWHILKNLNTRSTEARFVPPTHAGVPDECRLVVNVLGRSCSLQLSWLFSWRLSNLAKLNSQEKQTGEKKKKKQQKKRKLASSRLVQPTPYWWAITHLQLHPGFCLISGSAWPCMCLLIAAYPANLARLRQLLQLLCGDLITINMLWLNVFSKWRVRIQYSVYSPADGSVWPCSCALSHLLTSAC